MNLLVSWSKGIVQESQAHIGAEFKLQCHKISSANICPQGFLLFRRMWQII